MKQQSMQGDVVTVYELAIVRWGPSRPYESSAPRRTGFEFEKKTMRNLLRRNSRCLFLGQKFRRDCQRNVRWTPGAS
ncbi:MAG: hypothetical protein R3D69_13105 [Xanthobacteraceae bacterium]